MLCSLGAPREHESCAKSFVERASFVLAYHCSGSFLRWIMGGGTSRAAPLSLLEHRGSALLSASDLQLHCLLHLRRRHGALQGSERLRDGGSTDAGGERDKLLRFRAADKHHPIFLARLQAGRSD